MTEERREISHPREGLSTIVAEYAFLLFDRAVEDLKKLRAENTSEEAIRRHLEKKYKNLGARNRKLVYQISLGLTAREDILTENLRSETQLSDSKLEVEIDPDSAEQLVPGTVTYFRQQRWAVLRQDAGKLILKRF